MPTDEERAAFKRQEREAAAAIMAGDRYCPDPSAHREDRPGIDVELLAEAIFNATTSRGHAEHDSEECETCRWFRTLSNEVADDAAREYARLSEHPDTGDAPQS